jgi:hypothetical protein
MRVRGAVRTERRRERPKKKVGGDHGRDDARSRKKALIKEAKEHERGERRITRSIIAFLTKEYGFKPWEVPELTRLEVAMYEADHETMNTGA